MGSTRFLLLVGLAAAAVPPGTVLWNASVGCHHWGPGCWIPNFSGTDSTPALSRDGRVVAVGSYDGTVYAVKAADGAPAWTVAMDMGVGETTPALTNGGCFAVCGLREVRCVDAATGAQVWSRTPGGQLASCGAYDATRDLLFVGTLDKQLWALRGGDGSYAWSYDASGPSNGELWATHGARVDVDAGRVCFGVGGEAYVRGNCSATVVCANSTTGAEIWRARTGIQIQSTPSLGASSLYVGDYDNCLYAFEAADGAPRWTSCVAGGRLESSSAVYDLAGVETVVVGSGDGFVYAFRGADGAVTWKTKLGRPVSTLEQGGVGSSPRVGGGVVYVGGPDAFFALDAATGAVAWSHAVGAMVGSSPVVAGNAVYVGAEDGYLRAFAR